MTRCYRRLQATTSQSAALPTEGFPTRSPVASPWFSWTTGSRPHWRMRIQRRTLLRPPPPFTCMSLLRILHSRDMKTHATRQHDSECCSGTPSTHKTHGPHLVRRKGEAAVKGHRRRSVASGLNQVAGPRRRLTQTCHSYTPGADRARLGMGAVRNNHKPTIAGGQALYGELIRPRLQTSNPSRTQSHERSLLECVQAHVCCGV